MVKSGFRENIVYSIQYKSSTLALTTDAMCKCVDFFVEPMFVQLKSQSFFSLMMLVGVANVVVVGGGLHAIFLVYTSTGLPLVKLSSNPIG